MEKNIRKEIYIKLYYSLLDWAWIHNPNTFVVFIHLLLHANRKDQPYEKDVIHRGEVLCSREFLAKETGLSIQQVRTALDHLMATGEISQRIVNNICVFRVNNYRKWQDGNKASTSEQQRNNNASTNNQQTINNSLTTPIYCNNEENVILKECECEKGTHARGRLNNVYITDEEYALLKNTYPEAADKAIDELSAKIATRDPKYKDGHIGHLFVFADKIKPQREKQSAPSYDAALATESSKRRLDPTRTKREVR